MHRNDRLKLSCISFRSCRSAKLYRAKYEKSVLDSPIPGVHNQPHNDIRMLSPEGTEITHCVEPGLALVTDVRSTALAFSLLYLNLPQLLVRVGIP